MNNLDVVYMKRALQLAEKGRGTVSPNPLVGAVIVKNEKVLGEGYHLKKGEAHAEVNAVNNAMESVEGATLYCTLEPCCHTNKTTPPCTEFLISKKIARVVVATLDPNPEVSGKGLEKLRSQGIECHHGILENEARKQNKVFFHNMEKRRPFVHLKAALTLDGRMASSTGSSKWISSPSARSEVHDLRFRYDAILVGRGTLEADDPMLTARRENSVIKKPLKVIAGHLNESHKNLKAMKEPENVVNIYKEKPPEESLGISKKIKFQTWDQSMDELYQLGITSILVEGGPQLLSDFIESGQFQELSFYVCPKLIGNGPRLYESLACLEMERAKKIKGQWRILDGGDAVLEAEGVCLQA